MTIKSCKQQQMRPQPKQTTRHHSPSATPRTPQPRHTRCRPHTSLGQCQLMKPILPGKTVIIKEEVDILTVEAMKAAAMILQERFWLFRKMSRARDRRERFWEGRCKDQGHTRPLFWRSSLCRIIELRLCSWQPARMWRKRKAKMAE